MAQPDFIARLRRGPQEPQEWPAEAPADPPVPRARNPFLAATDDLAAQWDAMVVERDSAKDEAERHRAENVYLSGKVDELTRELAHRVSFFELELDRLTKRADKATDENMDRRAKLEIIAKALTMVLDETIAGPSAKRETAPVRERPASTPRNLSTAQQPRDYNNPPREGHAVSDDDAEDARDLLNRLHPVALAR
jgi:phage-related minor tail protein